MDILAPPVPAHSPVVDVRVHPKYIQGREHGMPEGAVAIRLYAQVIVGGYPLAHDWLPALSTGGQAFVEACMPGIAWAAQFAARHRPSEFERLETLLQTIVKPTVPGEPFVYEIEPSGFAHIAVTRDEATRLGDVLEQARRDPAGWR